MEAPQLARLSPAGDLLAVSSPDGRLALWSGGDGGGARLEQHLVPSHHLESSPTCLAWAPAASSEHSKRKRKKKEEVVEEGEGADLVALGTAVGALLLYSAKQGCLVTVLKAEGVTSILSLAWSPTAAAVYTAGEGGQVATFNIAKQKLLNTFQVGTDAIYSLAVTSDEATLVAASRDIKVWDLASRSLVKTLRGHGSPVTCLVLAQGRAWSAAQEERVVSVWALEGEERGQEMALAVNEGVAEVAVREDGEEVEVAVVTTTGALLHFAPRIGGKKHKKPVKPLTTVTIAADKDEKGRVAQIPVLAARTTGKGEVMLGHGAAGRPSIERLEVLGLEARHCLVRARVEGRREEAEEFTKTVAPVTDGAVTFLAPGVSLPLGTGKLGKRKVETKLREESLPMEDRLALLTTAEGSKAAPRTDTMAQLLAQGLHSNDQRILSSVLDRADPQLIDNTVRRIPAEAVVPLVQTLMRFIKGRGRVDASHAKWLRSVLGLHTGYLVSVPECRELLTPVFALLEARTHHYNQVLQLRGKLDLLTKQTEAAGGDQEVDGGAEALLVYQDDSSDEMEGVMDDLLVPASDTDDDFEEDMEDDAMEASKLDSDSDSCVEVANGSAGESDED